MTLKVTQGHLYFVCSIGHISLPISGLVVRNNESGAVFEIVPHLQCT